jgi:hypothetical protein
MLPLKRIRRILLNAATVLSLVTCTITVVLWVRSYRTEDVFAHAPLDPTADPTLDRESRPEFLRVDYWSVSSARGRVVLSRVGSWVVDAQTPEWVWERSEVSADSPRVAVDDFPRRWQLYGFGWVWVGTRPPPDNYPSLHVHAPHWFVVAVVAALPLRWMYRRARAAVPAGHCPACGYDLRATPDRCPECGTTTITPARP